MALSACVAVGRYVDRYRVASCFAMARVTLGDAIATAERAHGKRVIDIEYEEDNEANCDEDEVGHYHVTLYADGQLDHAVVDAGALHVDPPHDEGYFAHLFKPSDAEMSRIGEAANRVRISLGTAVEIAERGGGRAMAAYIVNDAPTLKYAIKLFPNGQPGVVLIDGETGTLQ